MIALGCDHGGYELKQEIIKYLEENNLPFKDFGCYDNSSVDYPIYARKVTDAITHGECDKGILICGTGIGISIAANKVPGIRAALCTDCFCAEATRLHNDANILCMGGRVVGPGLAVKITDTFLNTPFSNDERHIKKAAYPSKDEQAANSFIILYYDPKSASAYFPSSALLFSASSMLLPFTP